MVWKTFLNTHWQQFFNTIPIFLGTMGFMLFVPPLIYLNSTPDATYVVTSTANSGSGTLREALQNATNDDTITFSTATFPPTNPATIFLSSELPSIHLAGLTIDASNAGVIINGSGMPDTWNDCLSIENASNITIQGIQFIACRDHGIEIRNNVNTVTIGGDRNIGSGPMGQGNRFAKNQRGMLSTGPNISNITIKGNFVGTDLAGTVSDGNQLAGMALRDVNTLVIGGSSIGERNLFSGNGLYGLEIWNSTNVTIEGNYIGTNINGTTAMGNTDSGMLVVNSSNAYLFNNLVSGNRKGGAIFDNVNGVTAHGNKIGTDATGSYAISNSEVGLGITGTSFIIGGTQPGQGNLVSGNLGWTGIQLQNDSSTLTTALVQGNKIGTDQNGTAAIPNAHLGIYISGADITFGGDSIDAGNLIAGNGETGFVAQSLKKIPYVASVINNVVGTNITGTTAISNGSNGIDIYDFAQATVKNNLISGSGATGWTGLNLQGGSSDASAIVQGNLIGTNRSGLSAIPNEHHGIFSKQTNITIGGKNVSERNIISGNHGSGIDIENTAGQSFTATIVNNYIGTNVTGNVQIGNTDNAIYVKGTTQVIIDGNVLSGSGENGINIDGNHITQARICNNKIGTNALGTTGFGNQGNGIWAQYTDLTIGDGSSCPSNLISGNTGSGIAVDGDNTTTFTARGNLIGTDIHGNVDLGNGGDGVWIQGYNIVFGGPNPSDTNLVSGGQQSGLVIKGSSSAVVQNNKFGTNINGTTAIANTWNGLTLNTTQNAQVFANIFSGNLSYGIAVEPGSSNIQIYGNIVGMDSTGSALLSNQKSGILIDKSSYVTIGGNTEAQRNIISANGEFGVVISNPESSHNIISGNYIGINLSGTTVFSNGYAGIGIFNGASSNRIGGDSVYERNVIVGNMAQGINIGGYANEVINNYIGIDPTGLISMGNHSDGVTLHIPDIGTGGENIVRNNLISSNSANGITIYADNNTILGNIIGTDVTGENSLGNHGHGIYISGDGNIIGGANESERNLISGNTANGISLGIDKDGDGNIIRIPSNNTIQGNYIGTDKLGEASISNSFAGVYFSGNLNTLGGASSGQGNLISGNQHEGVALGDASSTYDNLVQGNLIGTDYTGQKALPNGDVGISLWAGVTNNTIGGDTSEKGNIVAYNRNVGVAVWQNDETGEGVDNTISNNTIHHNGSNGLRITVNTNLGINNVYGNGDNRIFVPAGTILNRSREWSVQGKADSFFVYYPCPTCEFVVDSQSSLTLQQGVKLYMDYNRKIVVQGSLNAYGTEKNTIKLTGPRDNIWSGDWEGIVFAAGSKGNLQYTEVVFAKIGLDVAGALSLSNSTISGNKLRGIRVTGNGTLALSQNSIGGNFTDQYNPSTDAHDIENQTASTINAQGTWWGRVQGPDSKKIIGNVNSGSWRNTERDAENLQNTWQAAELLTKGTHYFKISASDDLDWFRIPVMAGDSKIKVKLTNLSIDYDVFLFGQLGGVAKYTGDIGGRRLVNIARIMHIEENQSLNQLDTIARIMNIGQFSDDGNGLDTGQLLRGSTNSSTKNEELEFEVGNQVGWYYILVAGNNGAFDSKQRYTLDVQIEPGAGEGKDNYPVPVFPPINASQSAETLFITNISRLEERYGQPSVSELLNKLQEMAELPSVNGQIIDVAACSDLYLDKTWFDCNKIFADAYSNWDGHPEDVYYANITAATIKSLLSTIRTSYPNLKYIVIVGSDEIIPYWRTLDESPMANESGYSSFSLLESPIGSALKQGYFFIDDYYAQFEPITWRNRELYLPQYAIGRLVETPDEMKAMVQSYIDHPTLEINSALITGYDFLKDQAQAVEKELSMIPTPPATLINDYWLTNELTSNWFSAPPDFVSLNAHFTHWQAFPGSLNERDPFLPEIIQNGLQNADGTLVYSVGCHAGLSMPDDQTNEHALDFSQVFAGKGVTFIANTGYGFGDVGSIGYSELLSVLFLRQIKSGASTVGDALAQAKNEYFQQTGAYSLSPYDEKVIGETTLYGFPMLSIKISGAQTAKQMKSTNAESANVCSTSLTTSFELQAQSIDCQIPTDKTTTDIGDYYSIYGQTEVNMGQPIQPSINLDISLPNTVAHGMFFEGGEYYQFDNFDPAITRVITGRIDENSTEPNFTQQVWTPSSWDVVNSIRVQGGMEQRLVIIPAQYRPLTGSTGIERVFHDMRYTAYYSTSHDDFLPLVWNIAREYQQDAVKVHVKTFDTSGIARVAVTYTKGDGFWITNNLSKENDNDWSGFIPKDDGIQFFIQVLDNAGNVAVADNKGDYYVITYTISGNTGIGDATLRYVDGSAKTVTSDTTGKYSIIVPFGWTGTVTPSKAGYIFTPASLSYANVEGDQVAQDYTATPGARVDVYVGSGTSPQGTYPLKAGGDKRLSYDLSGGPVKVESTNGKSIVSAIRLQSMQNGTLLDYNETIGIPESLLSTKYYFPVYENKWALLSSQLRFAHLGIGTKKIKVTIGKNVYSYDVEEGKDKRISLDESGGPVIVESDDGTTKIIAAIRLQCMSNGMLNCYSETLGIPAERLSTKYYFPVYENKWAPLSSQIRFAHLGSGSKKIKVIIGTEVVWYDYVNEGSDKRLSFDRSGGPMIVESDDGTTKIIAAIRLQSIQGGMLLDYNESMGIPYELLSTKYYFPVYENKWAPLNSQVRFAHLGSGTKKVKVTIGGEVVWYDYVDEGKEKRLFFDKSGGPVIVESDDGVTPIIAAIRLQGMSNGVLNCYSETPGIPYVYLAQKYYFPVYENKWAPLNSQIRFGVP